MTSRVDRAHKQTDRFLTRVSHSLGDQGEISHAQIVEYLKVHPGEFSEISGTVLGKKIQPHLVRDCYKATTEALRRNKGLTKQAKAEAFRQAAIACADRFAIK